MQIKQKNAQDIQSAFEMDANNFGWGPAISSVQIDNAAAPATWTILTEAQEITLEMIQKHARQTWGTLAGLAWADPIPADLVAATIDPGANAAQRPQFFCRTWSIMIVKRLMASIEDDSLKSLMLNKHKFSWTKVNGTIHYDGPTMLWLLLKKINPSVCVGISTLKTSLAQTTMPKYKHNVRDMLHSM